MRTSIDTLAIPEVNVPPSEPFAYEPALDPSFRNRLRNSRLARSVLTFVAATGLYVASTTFEAAPAQADDGLEYVVQDTEVGVFARNSPHENDTERRVGQGAYDGDIVELLCGVTNGDPVGPYNNHTWHKVRDKTNGQGPFWINDHWVDTPNIANQLAPGEKNCNEGTSTSPQLQTPTTSQYFGNCKENTGSKLLQSWNDALASIDSAGEFKSQLEQWTSLWGNPNAAEVCVGALLSRADSANHRRFVSSVVAVSPTTLPTGCSGANLVEIWGDNFYKSTPCTEPQKWSINKWLKGGSYICAALSKATDFHYYKSAADAATAVKNGDVKLGSADPDRRITCTPVKA